MDLSDVVAQLLLLTATILTPRREGSEVVQTRSGALEGYQLRSRNGRLYKAFSGIPYGRPPIGPLRFKDPLPAEPWKGVRQAKINVKCVEYQNVFPFEALRFTDGQEDCLRVSVYTHSTDPRTANPVLVYLHGGAFEFRLPPGTWFNPTFFMDYDMVVVIVSYRLNMFGFLSFEDDSCPGNMGLKDQNLALRWVQENIHSFGGDSRKVTLMGESAGAVSTHYHAINPRGENLITRAILQSGSSYAFWAFDPPGEGRKRALRLAEFAGCKRGTTEQMVECLRDVPTAQLNKLSARFRGYWDRDPIVLFKPVVEKPGPNAIITDIPDQWNPVSVPMMTGLNNDEGLLKSCYMLLSGYDFEYASRNLDDFLPESLFYNNSYTSDVKLTTSNIIQRYLNGRRDLTREDEPAIAKMFADGMFLYPFAKTVSNSVNTVFLYLNRFMYKNIYIIKGRTVHTQELFAMLEPEVIPNQLKGPDLQFSKDLVKRWSNFIIRGTPNDEEEVWTPTASKSIEDLDYFVFSNDGNSMIRGLYAEDIRFWDENSALDRLNRRKLPSAFV